MPKKIYNKSLIMIAYFNRSNIGITIKQICQIFRIDAKTINNYKSFSPEKLSSSTIKRISFMNTLSDELINFVLSDAINNAFFKVSSLIKKIKKNFKISITSRQLYIILKTNNITHKKAVIKKKPKDAHLDQLKIDDVISDIKNINNTDDKDDVLFIDEVHIETRDINKYGWNVKGKDAIFETIIPNKANKRFTVIASVSKNHKIFYKIFKSSNNGKVFKNFIKEVSKKTKIKNFYLDNASIHKCKIVKNELIKNGRKVIYGVPYNPQLNIIENFFRSFKSKIRHKSINERFNIKKLIRTCWNEVSVEVLMNTYNKVYH